MLLAILECLRLARVLEEKFGMMRGLLSFLESLMIEFMMSARAKMRGQIHVRFKCEIFYSLKKPRETLKEAHRLYYFISAQHVSG